jgi:hypothetical protein
MGVKLLQGEVSFVNAAYIFCILQRCIFCSFSWNCFLVFVQNISKKANYEEFLTKFVNTSNHTQIFFHVVIILQDANNCSQHAKIFDAWQKLTFCRVDKKGIFAS